VNCRIFFDLHVVHGIFFSLKNNSLLEFLNFICHCFIFIFKNNTDFKIVRLIQSDQPLRISKVFKYNCSLPNYLEIYINF